MLSLAGYIFFISLSGGIHRGESAGRSCQVVAGSIYGGKVQGTYASKMVACYECEFYNRVKNDEGKDFTMSDTLLKKLRRSLKIGRVVFLVHPSSR